jgi:hypothetical protein
MVGKKSEHFSGFADAAANQGRLSIPQARPDETRRASCGPRRAREPQLGHVGGDVPFDLLGREEFDRAVFDLLDAAG